MYIYVHSACQGWEQKCCISCCMTNLQRLWCSLVVLVYLHLLHRLPTCGILLWYVNSVVNISNIMGKNNDYVFCVHVRVCVCRKPGKDSDLFYHNIMQIIFLPRIAACIWSKFPSPFKQRKISNVFPHPSISNCSQSYSRQVI